MAALPKMHRALVARTLAVPVIALLWTATVAQEHYVAASVAAPASAHDVLYVNDDLLFLSHMIVHHEQALELAALMPSRTQRDELLRFARYVDSEQRAEIEQMRSLLQLAQERGITVPEHRMHGDPPMPGMLSRRQMVAIAAASGAKFERLWLEGMILHHEGALDMARAQQQRQFESGRRPYGIDVLLDDILVVQRAEIVKMRSMLDK
jgi:uncharacterized protein (DUF305 family)